MGVLLTIFDLCFFPQALSSITTTLSVFPNYFHILTVANNHLPHFKTIQIRSLNRVFSHSVPHGTLILFTFQCTILRTVESALLSHFTIPLNPLFWHKFSIYLYEIPSNDTILTCGHGGTLWTKNSNPIRIRSIEPKNGEAILGTSRTLIASYNYDYRLLLFSFQHFYPRTYSTFASNLTPAYVNPSKKPLRNTLCAWKSFLSSSITT